VGVPSRHHRHGRAHLPRRPARRRRPLPQPPRLRRRL